MKPIRYVNAVLAIIGFGLIGLLSFLRPDWLIWAGIFTFAAGYFLVVLFLTPGGGTILGDRTQALPLSTWIGKLILAHLALLILTIVAVIGFFFMGPVFARGTLTADFAKEVIQNYSLIEWGIFPWGVYAFWGLGLAYVVYVKRGEPYLYQLVRGYSPKWFEPMVKTYTEASTSAATVLALALAATAVILTLTYAFEYYVKATHFINPVFTVVILSILPPFFATKFGRKFLRRLPNSFGFLMILTIGASLLLMMAAAIANAYFAYRHPEMIKQFECHQCGNYFANVPLKTRFGSLYWGWWLMWAPLAGSYLALISQGRSIRAYILGTMIVPVAIFAILYLWGKPLLVVGFDALQTVPYPYLFIVLGILGAGILYALLKGHDTSQLFFAGFLPVSEDSPKDRLWLKTASKAAGIRRYMPKIIIIIIGTLFLHTMAGWYGIQFQVAAMGIFVINVVYCALELMLVRFFKEGVWTGNPKIPRF